MRKPTIIAIALLLTTGAYTSNAEAQGKSGMGFGAETMISTDFFGAPGSLALTYDTGKFHVTGLLTLINVSDGDTVIGLGGRFYYAIHTGDRSDFSVGGGLAIVNTDPNAGNSDTSIYGEGGAKIRVFLNDNVALGAAVGIGFVVADNDGPGPDQDVIGTGGQVTGSFGVTYFFW